MERKIDPKHTHKFTYNNSCIFNHDDGKIRQVFKCECGETELREAEYIQDNIDCPNFKIEVFDVFCGFKFFNEGCELITHVKVYTQEDIDSKFRNNKCLECKDGELDYTGSSPDGGWVSYYQCDNCHTQYQFQETDMGQTLPYLESNVKGE